jgi:hypothetical protein
MSDNFQKVDFANLPFPAEYLIDYVRVYQRPGIGVMGCDPADHPTAQYIADHANAYANPNLTTWEGAGYTFPVRLFLSTPPCWLWDVEDWLTGIEKQAQGWMYLDQLVWCQ